MICFSLDIRFTFVLQSKQAETIRSTTDIPFTMTYAIIHGRRRAFFNPTK